MKNKFLIYSLIGILSSGAVAGLGLSGSIQAQSSPALENSQQSKSAQVDQHFIEMMIPHHQNAIAMADIALTRSQRPEVKKIAEAIKKIKLVKSKKCVLGINNGTAKKFL